MQVFVVFPRLQFNAKIVPNIRIPTAGFSSGSSNLNSSELKPFIQFDVCWTVHRFAN